VKRLFQSVLAGAVLATLGAAAPAPPAPSETVIRVGVSPLNPLVIVKESGLVVKGLFPEIVESAAARNGWSVRYVPDTLANNLARLDRGTLDLVAPVPWSSARTPNLEYSKAILSSWGEIYASPDVLIRAAPDLAGKTVAVVRGSPHYQNLLATLKDAGVVCEFVEMNDCGQIFDALASQHVDAGLVDHLFGAAEAAGRGLKATFLSTAPVDFRFAALRSRNEPFLSAIDQWVGNPQSDPASPYCRAAAHWLERGPSAGRIALVLGLAALALAAVGAGAMGLSRLRGAARAKEARLSAEKDNLDRMLRDGRAREQTLETWEKWYQQLFNNTQDAVLVHGVLPDGQAGPFIEANDAACGLLGYSRQEFLSLVPRTLEAVPDTGKPPFSLLIQKSAGLRVGKDGTVSGTPTDKTVTYERTYRSKSGTEIPVDVTARVFIQLGRLAVMISARDITQRRQVQRALQESQRRFHDFFARSPIGIALYDTAQTLTDVNPSCLAMFGCSERSQFVKLNPFQAPEMTDEHRKTLLKGGTVEIELVLDFEALKERLHLQTARSGRCHFQTILTNLGLDAQFNPKGFLLQVEDVTENRRADEALRQNERLLRQAQKMEAVGTLAGGIAHDFNNILTPILGYTEMALQASGSNPSVRAHLGEVLKASHRAKDLVRQILTFSRQAERDYKPIRLTPIVNEVVMLLRGSLLPVIELRCEIQTDRDIVRADPTQIHQVLMNLCTNAAYAMRGKGGVLTVQMRRIALDSRTRGPLSRLKPDAYVEIAVRDTGSGMDRATLDRIFEPFFTTKQHGEGTGMGLAVAHGIVAALRGAITVESELGKGSTFRVVLPLIEHDGEPKAQDEPPLPRGTERILFVDDEPGIVGMVGQLLADLGYTPTTCLRSQEALALFCAAPDRFDLLITDQVMPVMTGLELVREARKTRPDVPVIMCTGFGKTVSESELADAGIREVLMKPIILRQLADAIRRALDGPRLRTASPTAPPS